MNRSSSSAPFQEERLGLGLYAGGCTCKNSNGDGSSNFFGFEIWANSVFSRGVSKTGVICLGYIKLRPTVALFHPLLQCNFALPSQVKFATQLHQCMV